MPTTNRARLTEAVIARAMRNPPAEGQTTFLRDSKVPGFAVRVHPSGQATYTLLLPKGQRMKFWGYYEPGGLELAREYAAKRLREARQGRDVREPNDTPLKAPTPTQSFDSSTKIEQVIREFTVRHLQQHTTYRHVCDSDTRFGRFVLP